MARKTLICPVTENLCVRGACSISHCADQSVLTAKVGASEFETNRKRESRIVMDWFYNPDSKDADAAMEILIRDLNKDSY